MLTLPNLQSKVPLAPLTTYKIGGPAELFVEVHSADELAAAVIEARRSEIPYFVLGTGANILVSDAGIPGLTILNRANHTSLVDNFLTAESGATIADLIGIASRRDLGGFEHFAGIPSSVGGALWQNLHFLAPDRQSTVYIGGILERATVLGTDNVRQVVDREFFRFGYDDSLLHHQPIVVLDATFQLTPKPSIEIEQQIQENLAWRRAKQPQLDDVPSCGSVFKKIEGVGAGRLIDRAGLKGTRVGGIQVSELNANYLINVDRGSARDVRQLIELIQKTVKEHSGYELEPEVGFVGKW